MVIENKRNHIVLIPASSQKSFDKVMEKTILNNKKRQKEEQCLNHMMVIFSASRLLSSLNTEVAPCENFYEFACGTWAKKNVIPEDVSSYTMFSVVREDVEVIMKSRSRRIKKETG